MPRSVDGHTTPTHDPAPTRERYKVVALGCTFAAVGYLMRVALAQVGPELQADLALSQTDWGQVMAVFAVAYGLFEIPSGYLGDTLGPRRTITLVVLGFSLMTVATGLSSGLVSLLVVRFVFGAFQAGIFPNIARMLAAWMPLTQRASAQGLIWMSTRIGGALSPLVIQALVDVTHEWQTGTQGWRWAVAGLALPGFVWALVFWYWFRDLPEQMPTVNRAEREWIERGRVPLAQHDSVPWGKLLGSLNLWLLCLAYGTGGFAAFFTISMLPTYLQKHLEASPDQSARILTLVLSLGAVACFAAGFLSDRLTRTGRSRKWGRRLFAFVGSALGGVLWIAFGLADSVSQAALLACGLVICYDMTMPVSWAAASDVGEQYAGTVSGMMNMFGNLGAALGSWTAGRMMDRHQTLALFVLFAGFYFASAVLWLCIDSTRPIQFHPAEEADPPGPAAPA